MEPFTNRNIPRDSFSWPYGSFSPHPPTWRWTARFHKASGDNTCGMPAPALVDGTRFLAAREDAERVGGAWAGPTRAARVRMRRDREGCVRGGRPCTWPPSRGSSTPPGFGVRVGKPWIDRSGGAFAPPCYGRAACSVRGEAAPRLRRLRGPMRRFSSCVVCCSQHRKLSRRPSPKPRPWWWPLAAALAVGAVLVAAVPAPGSGLVRCCRPPAHSWRRFGRRVRWRPRRTGALTPVVNIQAVECRKGS
jgi:hypothetical protein